MKDKLLTIVNYYGINKQLKYFQSEIFELNEAVIQHENKSPIVSSIESINRIGYKLSGKDYEPASIKHIAEEIADVLVMLEQIRINYSIPTSEIKEIMEYKVGRQLERIKGELENENS